MNVPLNQQVPNPVALFASDNNGVVFQLPAVPNGGSPAVNGSLVFGIGTQSNNGLGSATVLLVPDTGNNAGDIITSLNGQPYAQSFIDSGSNGYFFLDTNTTGLPAARDKIPVGIAQAPRLSLLRRRTKDRIHVEL